MKKIITITAVLLLSVAVSAQKNVKFTINHLSGLAPFASSTPITNDYGDQLKVNRLEYYISEITIVHDGGKETQAKDVYILANANSNDTINLGNYDITTVEAVNFAVGVDPGVNTDDPAKWASSHPLAPKAPSMHWGWAAGYRFVAIEGKSGVSFKEEFQIHGLGNKNYFKQNIPTNATNTESGLLIALNADYAKAVSGMVMSYGLIEHSDSKEAAKCLRNFQTKVFTSLIGVGNTLSTKTIEVSNAITLSPVPSNGQITVTTTDTRFAGGNITITDALGREVYNAAFSQNITLDTKGIYFVTAYGDGIKSTQRVIVQ